MRIRPAHPDDAPAVVSLRTRVLPYLVRGVAPTRQMIMRPPRGQHWTAFVAEVDNEIIGWVSAFRNASSTRPVGEISLLHVHPEHRGRGIGGGLLTAAPDHLTPLRLPLLRGRALPESLPYARRRGFLPSREERFSALALTALPPRQSLRALGWSPCPRSTRTRASRRSSFTCRPGLFRCPR